MIETLYSLGFTAGNPDDYFDKGKAPGYVSCLTRVHQGQHQYLTVTGYDRRFVEACLTVYNQPWNSRAKQKQVPIFSTLLRSLEDILAAVARVHPIPTKNPSP